ncbi:MAG: methyltransferase domain-containing protein [Armatimonadota bacterium]|nr:methyltransferase domain-containing protein [Armatimonadota bacterium]
MTNNKLPKTDPAKVQRFDAAAGAWDQDAGRVRMAETIARAVLARVPMRPGIHALDYGCGTGLITLQLAPHADFVLGADISDGMLSALRQKALAAGLKNVEVAHLDLEHDPPLERRFDLIVSSMTMHHVKDVRGVIRKLAAMLRPEGWLCIADLETEPGDFHSDKTGVEHFGFEPSEVVRMFEEAGLQRVTVENVFTIHKEVAGTQREFRLFLACGCRASNHYLQ